MENKKLLNFLLKDLNEIDELFSEKNTSEFDRYELEFIQTRLKGAIKLVQLFTERESSVPEPDKKIENVVVNEIIQEKVVEKEIFIETPIKTEPIVKIEAPAVVYETIVEVQETNQETRLVKQEETKEIIEKSTEEMIVEPGDVELEEEIIGNTDKRLGDVFTKEKSVNDLVTESNKLENILSNRPVKSIQSAIGINDRFQYIRELFEGKTDDFVKTIEELDRMSNLKEAVQFLQVNYKWKKNETSLKFVNLIKRRFTNE